MSAQSMADVRRQLRKFIDQELNPNDHIAIIRTSRGRREVPQFTNDKNLINRAWSQVVWNHCSRIGIKNAQPDPGLGCGYGAASFPETLRSIRSIVAAMGKVPGRKSMILFANHIPLREYESFERPKDSVLQADAPFTLANNYGGQLDKLSEIAIRAGVVIYAVDAAGLQVTSLQASESTTMAAGSAGNGAFVNHIRDRSLQIQTRREGAALLAKETGGFMIKDQNEFQFDRILEDQSGYYLIGYRPSEDTFNKRFHKLKASVKKSGMTVRTRSGFFGMSEEEANRKK
jgi:VWFA-related protein